MEVATPLLFMVTEHHIYLNCEVHSLSKVHPTEQAVWTEALIGVYLTMFPPSVGHHSQRVEGAFDSTS